MTGGSENKNRFSFFFRWRSDSWELYPPQKHLEQTGTPPPLPPQTFSCTFRFFEGAFKGYHSPQSRPPSEKRVPLAGALVRYHFQQFFNKIGFFCLPIFWNPLVTDTAYSTKKLAHIKHTNATKRAGAGGESSSSFPDQNKPLYCNATRCVIL